MPMKWTNRVEAGATPEVRGIRGVRPAEEQAPTGASSAFPPEDRESLHAPGRRPDLEVLRVHESRARQQFAAVIVRVLRKPSLRNRDDDIDPPVLPGPDVTNHD